MTDSAKRKLQNRSLSRRVAPYFVQLASARRAYLCRLCGAAMPSESAWQPVAQMQEHLRDVHARNFDRLVVE